MELKKIITKEEQAKKRKRRNLFIGIILVLIMVVSTAGYAFSGGTGNDENSQVEYNGVEFIKSANGYWVFQSSGREFATRYNPLELNETKASTGLHISNYQGKPLYIAGGSGESLIELRNNLWEIPERMQSACLTENCTGDFPVKNCSEDKIIAFKEPSSSEKARVYKDEECVFIVANSTEQLNTQTRFCLIFLGFEDKIII